MSTSMPSETITGIVGSVLGAVFVILGAYGVEITPAVAGAIMTLVGWLAFGVTLWVRRTRSRVVDEVPAGTAPSD